MSGGAADELPCGCHRFFMGVYGYYVCLMVCVENEVCAFQPIQCACFFHPDPLFFTGVGQSERNVLCFNRNRKTDKY